MSYCLPSFKIHLEPDLRKCFIEMDEERIKNVVAVRVQQEVGEIPQVILRFNAEKVDIKITEGQPKIEPEPAGAKKK